MTVPTFIPWEMAMTIRANSAVTVLGVLRPTSKNPMHDAWFIAGCPSWIALAFLMIFHSGSGHGSGCTASRHHRSALRPLPKGRGRTGCVTVRPVRQPWWNSIRRTSRPSRNRQSCRNYPQTQLICCSARTYDTAFYTLDRRYVQDMQADLDRLRALHADQLRHYQDLYVTLVSVRDFVAARAVLASQPMASSEPAPTIVGALVDGEGRRLWS